MEGPNELYEDMPKGSKTENGILQKNLQTKWVFRHINFFFLLLL